MSFDSEHITIKKTHASLLVDTFIMRYRRSLAVLDIKIIMSQCDLIVKYFAYAASYVSSGCISKFVRKLQRHGCARLWKIFPLLSEMRSDLDAILLQQVMASDNMIETFDSVVAFKKIVMERGIEPILRVIRWKVPNIIYDYAIDSIVVICDHGCIPRDYLTEIFV